MVRCEEVSHTQGGFVLKMETGGNLEICRRSNIDWRNAFEAFSSSLWIHFISRGRLLITYYLGDGKTDVGNKTELADEEGGGQDLTSFMQALCVSSS